MSKGPQLTDYYEREKLKRLVLDSVMMRYLIDDTIGYESIDVKKFLYGLNETGNVTVFKILSAH